MKFANPVIPGFYPDPSVCRVGEDYYLVNSSFGYFPGLPIFHSRDLVNWRQIGHCLSRDNQLPLTSKSESESFSFVGIYAPTIRHHNGRFYVITTNVSYNGNFIVWAERPEGPWSEPIYLDWPGIDPSLLFDQDGNIYITGTGSYQETPGIYQAQIDPDTGTLLSERRLVWEGTGGQSPEGPHLYRIGSFYYLLIAEGGTEYGHMVTLARSKQPYGPFEPCPQNPILTHRSIQNPIQATGHADLVQAHDGSWWAVFLGIRVFHYPYYHHLGRETYLAPVAWTEADWPVIGDQGQVYLEMEGPAFYTGGQDSESRFARDDFNFEYLGSQWNHIRNPQEGTVSLKKKTGWLTLYGTANGLDHQSPQTFIGRRQQDLECRVSALVSFEPEFDGEEVGLAAYMNEKAHYEIAVVRKDGAKLILFRRRIGSMWKVEREEPLEPGEIILAIRADAESYTFSYSQPGNEERIMGQGECSYLSTEVSGGFTGVYFGMYATGNGNPSQTPAFFDYFDYQR
ncbi:glycoside hydrolase family 43 protein [Gorillibacterium massiliense]|uniref:glycoside hydrolase family 43 protein n=1 Tax=Gorillibacterium massiliense TaxID=1280390 RepID=UPI0004AEACEF|nr:glycoside hydrolase family 43 protein [Gorillibacterium massiliense]